MVTELEHNWSSKPRPRLKGTLSIRTAKPDEPPDDTDHGDKPTQEREP